MIELRFGLADGEQKSLEAIGKQLGMPGERVHRPSRTLCGGCDRAPLDAHREAA